MRNLSSTRVLRMAVGGAVGGLLAFFLLDPGIRRMETGQAHSAGVILNALLTGLVVGVAIGVALVVTEELQSMNAGRISRMGLLGAGVGAICGVVGTGIAQLIFSCVGAIGMLLLPVGGMVLIVVGRTAGWAVMGAAAGICLGAVGRSRVRVRQGVIGGAIGGAIGGVTFDALGFLAGSGTPSRFFGFVVMGAAIGAAVGLVEELGKEFWITVLNGTREGRSYILSKPQTTLGRDELADIPLFGDGSVQRLHARLVKESSSTRIVPEQGLWVHVNSQPTAGATLSPGDIIAIGAHRLKFNSRRASTPTAYASQAAYTQPSANAATVQQVAQVTKVEVVSGPHTGEVFPLTSNPMVIGRDPGCTISLVRDGMASRKHAQIVWDGTVWRLDDTCSTNGTYVNGLRITSQALRPGDQIGVGQSLLRIVQIGRIHPPTPVPGRNT